ncbi:hypothetical protein F4810DRAFT_682235 [Camillea tinctor]|nr:hypothetical protein F4810DRAFT_682235 [Camillea tinctor]
MAIQASNTETLDTLRRLWARVLDEESNLIKDDDIFFDLGGDSLTASELIDVAEEEGLSITIEDLFNNPSLESLASCISSTASSASSVTGKSFSISAFSTLSHLGATVQDLTLIQRDVALKCDVGIQEIEDIYPCSPLQTALFASSLAGSDGYLTQLVYRLDPSISHLQLLTLWRDLSWRHPILRTRIVRDSRWGILQAVLRKPCTTNIFQGTLEACLSEDLAHGTVEGDELFRVHIVQDSNPLGFNAIVMTWHHAIMDAAALGALIHDAKRFSLKQDDDLERPTFASFIHQISISDITISDEFWTSQLSGAEPSKFPSTEVAGTHNARSLLEVKFDAPFNNVTGITPALILRAAWALLLARRTGNPDVVFAATLDGRSSTNTRTIVGPLITAVPIRLVLDLSKTVSQFFDQVREQAAAIMPHQHYGFQNIRRRLPAECQCTDHINSLLLVQAPESQGHVEDLRSLGMEYLPNVGKPFVYSFLLVNEVQIGPTGVTLQLRYDIELVQPDYIQNLASQYKQIVEELCMRPNDTLDSLRYLSDMDISIIRRWNSNYMFGTSRSCVELFLEQCSQRPTSQAVCSWDGTFTYEQLKAEATKLAYCLHGSGVGPGAIVAMCSEKSKWVMVSIFGILMSGAAWIPIDVSHPEDRISEVLRIANVKNSVCSTKHESRMAQHGQKTFVPEHVVQNYQNITSYPKSLPISLDSLAYVLFTSGSTGQPKGVMISHSALSNAIERQGRALGCDSSWRSLQFSNHTFDPSISESIQVLCHGGVVCIPSDTQRLDNLPEAIRVLDANCAQLTPSVLQTLSPQQVPSLRTIILVGEASNSTLISLWAPKVQLINAYGPTEACIYCTVARPMQPHDRPSFIGRQCGSTNWIVDPNDHEQLLPIGFAGEIVCSGPSLADGYLNNREATDAAFVECQWLQKFQPQSPSGQIYKTGDLGYYNQDGTLHLLGRKDNQIKLRGNRIELGEIENRLSTQFEGLAVQVAVPKSGLLKAQLVCVVCFAGFQTNSSKNGPTEMHVGLDSSRMDTLVHMCRQLSSQVPGYMIPAYWGVVNRMPLNNSGKLDRKALRLILESTNEVLRDELAKVYETIRNEDETCELSSTSTTSFKPATTAEKTAVQKMRAIWLSLLDISADKLQDTSSFFQLGGDSLVSITLVSKCRRAGINISVQDVIQCRTFGRLCQRVCAHLGKEKSEGERENLPKTAGLTPGQSQTIQGHTPEGLQDMRTWRRMQLKMEVPLARIKTAFDDLVLAHPMCTARIEQESRGAISFSSHAQYRFQTSLYCNLSQHQVSKIEKEAIGSLDAFDGPVFSADIYRFEHRTWMFIVAHPLFIDSASWTIILRDLDRAVAEKLPPTSPPHGIWELCGSDFAVEESDAGGQEKDQKVIRFMGLSWDEHRLDTTISSTLTSLGAAEALFLKDTETVAEIAVLQTLRTFSKEFDCSGRQSSVRVILETKRPSEFERVVGNFNATTWDFDLGQIPETDLGWSTLRLKIHQKMQETIWNVPNEELVQFPSKTARPADLLVHVRIREQEDDMQEWTVLDNVDGPLSKAGDFRISSGGFIKVNLEILADKILTSCTFDSRIEQSQGLTSWITNIWQDVRSAVGFSEQTIEYNRREVVSELQLSQHDADILDSKLDNGVEYLYIASPMQRQMHSSYTITGYEFHLQYTFRLTSTSQKLDVGQILKAWRHLASRHDALRTRLVMLPRSSETICLVDSASRKDSPEFPGLSNTIQQHLDVSEIQDGSIKCVLNIHHALVDGQSMSLLITELAYELDDTGRKHDPPSTSSFRALALKSRRATHPVHEAYWIESVFDRVAPCILQSPSGAGSNGVMAEGAVGRSSSRGVFTLEPFPRRRTPETGVQVAAILDLAWARVLQQCTGADTPVFGNIVSGRDVDSATDLSVGPGIHLVVSHIDLSHVTCSPCSTAWSQMLHSVQEQRIHNLTHAVGCLTAAKQAGVDLMSKTLFNTATNFQKGVRPRYRRGDITVEVVDLIDPWPVSAPFHTKLVIDCQHRLTRSMSWFVHGKLTSICTYVSSIGCREWGKDS